ncbi:MAG: hypothetical protein IKV21_06055 [Clostridia bacterium]|nr:hypothetical protein [Clostridia bacterium]
MDKSNKIIAILLAAIAGVFAVVVAVAVVAMNKDDTGNDVTITASDTVAATVPADTTAAPVVQTTESTTVTTTQAPTPLSELILGQWSDSSNTSGYTFYADGRVDRTYVNLVIPFVNIPVNGTSRGTYTLNGDKLTTKFSIYTATIEDTYTVKVENNSISMKDHEDGETATYQRVSSAVTSTQAAVTGEITDVEEIVGSWINDDSTVRYAFNGDSTVKITFSNAKVASVSTSVLNGEYTGVYLTEGNSVIIQFTVNGQKITQKCTFSVSRNTLALTDETGSTNLYVREGTAIVNPGSGDLMGKWADSTGVSGYEFKEGGIVVVTNVNFNVPVVNIQINDSYTGAYTISGNKITVSYNLGTSSFSDTYEYTVNGNTLIMISSEGKTYTYIRK